MNTVGISGPKNEPPASHSQQERAARGLIQGCALLAGAIAVVAGTAWFFGKWSFATFGSEYVPMAPNTAWLLLLLSGVVFLRGRKPDWKAGRIYKAAALGLVGAVSLLIIARTLFSFPFDSESWMLRSPASVGGLPVGRMSVYTATMFLIATAAVAFLRDGGRSPRASSGLALALSTAVLAGNAHVIVSYAMGIPLLYGSGLIPMALLTAIAFMLLGIGLIAACHPGRYIHSLFGNPSKGARDIQSRQYLWPFSGIFVLLFFGIGAAGFYLLRDNLTDLRSNAEAELLDVAKLKAKRIQEWRAEMLGDANWLLHGGLPGNDVRLFLQNPADTGLRNRLASWIANWRRYEIFSRVLLVDPAGKVRLAAPAAKERIGAGTEAFISKAVAEKRIVIQDLHESATEPNAIIMDVLVPVFARPEPGGNSSVVGVLVEELDPNEFLYPMIRKWPTPSSTGETLLVRRDNDEAVYLNNLRDFRQAALKIKVPITQGNSPAVKAVLGEEGIVEGVSYHGVPALAAMLPISGSPWFIVAIKNQSEILAPMRRLAWITSAAVGALTLVALFGLALLWRRRELIFAERELTRHTALMADLKRANSELENLIYVASHDLRTPLVNLQGFGQRLEKDCAELLAQGAPTGAASNEPSAADRIAKSLHYIRSSASKMDALINGLLRVSRIGHAEVNIQTIDMNQLLKQARTTLEFQIQQAGADVQVGPLPPCRGDPQLLGQVFSNLIDNALKYRAPPRPLRIEVSGRMEKGESIYCVADTGLGIAVEHQNKIWEMFHRLDPAGPVAGEGLGLKIVRRIVERHRGRIWMESTAGEGSRFFVAIPKATGGAAPLPSDPTRHYPPPMLAPC